jgi:hypothetical protein
MVLAALATGCAQEKRDYTLFHQHMPKTVLVLPPINGSAEVMASDKIMATITQPVAEMGYYVYPIVVVSQYMRENGLPTPGDMHQAPLNKLREVYGADAVLYVEIESWATQYIVINATTRVKLKYRLVDTQTGEVLWSHEQEFARSSGGGGIAEALVNAAVHAAGSAGHQREVAAQCNAVALTSPESGLLWGGRYPNHEELNAKK